MAVYGYSCVFKREGKIAETTVEEIEQKIGCTISQAIQKSVSMKKAL